MLLRSPPRETQFITAMSVGAVSSITTFMGTAAALAVTVLVGTQQPVGSPSFGTLISFTMPTLWLFVLLTVRFDLACYLYQVWDLRGRPGDRGESERVFPRLDALRAAAGGPAADLRHRDRHGGKEGSEPDLGSQFEATSIQCDGNGLAGSKGPGSQGVPVGAGSIDLRRPHRVPERIDPGDRPDRFQLPGVAHDPRYPGRLLPPEPRGGRDRACKPRNQG